MIHDVCVDFVPLYTSDELVFFSTKLHKVLTGPINDAKEITDWLTLLRNKHRLEVKEIYLRDYGRDLIADLNSKLGAKFEDVVAGFMLPPVEFLCQQLHKAMNTDETTLAEIICTKSNEELTEIVETYEKMYNSSLAEDFCREMSNHFRRLLKLIVSVKRDPDSIVDTKKARKQAVALYAGGRTRMGRNQEVFNEIFARCSYAQLGLVFDIYATLSRSSVEEAMMRQIAEDVRLPMINMVRCMRSPVKYFARRLALCLDNPRSDDTAIIRIIISRAEIDLDKIKQEFDHDYYQTFVAKVMFLGPPEYESLLRQLIACANIN